MSSRPVRFKLLATDPATHARAGEISTPHGIIRTPVFMPVGTQGAIRCLVPDQVQDTGAQIILANTYHMSIRPGEDLVKKAGGLHRFMGYEVPILTDSGGFQVFSLPDKEITEEGVAFRYEVNGQRVILSPERSMQIQQDLGADIAMAFDECPPYPSTYEYALESLERTTRWERRSRAAHTRHDQALFGIVQGSVFEDLRRRSAREIVDIGFDGYAIGGLSVGEGLEIMSRVLEFTVPELPANQPRYLMGVGFPDDILAAVERGVDMFDCVIPTRHARGGILYTFQGRLRVQHARYRKDMYPIDTHCQCYTCRHFSRAYIRHLFTIREVLGSTLASIHNIYFYQQLMARIRDAIQEGRFLEFKRSFMASYRPGDRSLELPADEEVEAYLESDFDTDFQDEWTKPEPARSSTKSRPATRTGGKGAGMGSFSRERSAASGPSRSASSTGPSRSNSGRGSSDRSETPRGPSSGPNSGRGSSPRGEGPRGDAPRTGPTSSRPPRGPGRKPGPGKR